VPKLLINNLLKSKVSYEYGHLDIDLFLKKLQQEGITDIRIEQISETEGILTRIELMNKEMIINITDKETHMICENVKQAWRLKIRDLMLSCVNKF
jgi:integrator complex subunit 9